jgi:Holliday junction resolvasome RuvABC endonuclease subunit
MGVKSAFTFGNGFGHLEMALTAAGIPFERVRPQVWQKALGCMTKGEKNVSKRKAQELFPSMKVTHAIADALLLAYYGSRKP